ncbi:unnamed protein product [Cunninghamella blakesleeana]
MKPSYNMKSSAVKRILQEARELSKEDNIEFEAHPLEDNIFEWHFTISGPKGTDFEGGRYHGRILLPAEYPFKPPHLIFLTPNGRFELHTKVCLSVTDHHPEFWRPSWGIRTVLLAIMGFLPTPSKGALGGLDYPKEERQRLAKKSKTWTCNVCNIKNGDFFSNNNKTGSSSSSSPINDKKSDEKEQIELPLFTFKAEPPSNENNPGSKNNTKPSSPQLLSNNSNDSENNETSSHPIQKNDFDNHLSNNGPSSTTNEKSNTVNILDQASSSSSSSSPVTHNYMQSLFWLDFLIGALITLLLYILYRKYM